MRRRPSRCTPRACCRRRPPPATTPPPPRARVPLALPVSTSTAEQLKRKGAPFAWFGTPPAVARANGLAIAKRAPHPRAARLYYGFMLGEAAQAMLVERGFMPASRKLKGPLAI